MKKDTNLTEWSLRALDATNDAYGRPVEPSEVVDFLQEDAFRLVGVEDVESLGLETSPTEQDKKIDKILRRAAIQLQAQFNKLVKQKRIKRLPGGSYFVIGNYHVNEWLKLRRQLQRSVPPPPPWPQNTLGWRTLKEYPLPSKNLTPKRTPPAHFEYLTCPECNERIRYINIYNLPTKAPCPACGATIDTKH